MRLRDCQALCFSNGSCAYLSGTTVAVRVKQGKSPQIRHQTTCRPAVSEICLMLAVSAWPRADQYGHMLFGHRRLFPLARVDCHLGIVLQSLWSAPSTETTVSRR